MRWISASAYASAAALVAAVAAQLLGWTGLRAWLLLVWAVLLFFTVIGLFDHPMRWPAWGLFAGFWGAVGVLWLVVIQIFAVADVLHEPAYGAWAAWPLALIGVWFLVASLLGLGNDVYPGLIDALGILAGVGLVGVTITIWTGLDSATRPGAGLTAGVYVLYAIGLGLVFWGSPTRAETLRTTASH